MVYEDFTLGFVDLLCTLDILGAQTTEHNILALRWLQHNASIGTGYAKF